MVSIICDALYLMIGHVKDIAEEFIQNEEHPILSDVEQRLSQKNVQMSSLFIT
jgi:hypothetical protein